ncbi:MAG: hypothetical protein RMJ28_03185 [Nitrososphaerota archaeon]|nr:hypothetical protein [Candidatus Calditenuaceae archaeon]MDW8073224.1 hypothetical protein [Nitrososphaerota archaeon]
MSSEEEPKPDEEEIVVNLIETPRGRVPEFESTFRALEKISARLLEQDEKIERVAARLASGGQIAPGQLKEILQAVESVRAELAALTKRLELLEDSLGEIQERLNLLDYIADIIERYLRPQEG